MSGSIDGFGGGLARRLTLGRATRSVRHVWYRSAAYNRLLSWQPQIDLKRTLPLRPAVNSRVVAEAVLDGRLPLAGRTLPFGTLPWSVPPPGPGAGALMHGFSWLVDLKTRGGEPARARAQDLLRGWIRAYPRWDELAWRPGILGRRLIAWITCADFVLANADVGLRNAFYRSLNMQAQHLLRALPDESGSEAAFAGITGALAATLALGIGDRGDVLGVLEREIDRQVLADGCHLQRNPAVHLAVLRHLLEMRAMLIEAEAEVPLFVGGTIERMVAMLRFFRHGDGGLALFNGGKEGLVHVIDATLAEAAVKERPPASAPAGAFERLAAGPVLIVLDGGGPPPAGADLFAHAAPGAFEMSVGRERLIVNCGGFVGDEPSWRAAVRSTAAHSAAMIDNVNAVALDARGNLRRRRVDVRVVRRTAEGASWLEVDHDGYAARFAAICRRRLYMDALGEDIRGEDVCEGRGGTRFVVRFHLHPRVGVAFEDGSAGGGVTGIRLTLPGGAIYRFISIGGTMALDDSVYLGVSDVPEPTRQIVVSAAFGAKVARIKWALRRVDQDLRQPSEANGGAVAPAPAPASEAKARPEPETTQERAAQATLDLQPKAAPGPATAQENSGEEPAG
ncbi:MAG: heparinase II/III family protein [Rhodospirillales bacterium]|nr:heparinase II/III family protein [Rhodospirillales bacterium]